MPRASWLRKSLVSSDQRPPTSPASTTRRALPRGPANSGQAPCFLPSCGLESCAIDVGASWEGGTVTPQSGHQRGVDRKLNPTEHGQPVRHDFQPPCIAWVCKPRQSPRLLPPNTPWRQRSPLQILAFPTPQPSHKLLGGGHGNRVDGHTGRCAWTWREGDESAATRGCGTSVGQSAFRRLLDTHCERGTSSRAASRSHHCVFRLRHGREQPGLGVDAPFVRRPRAANVCRKVPGSFSSGSRGGGLAPNARACQVGGVNPGSGSNCSARCVLAVVHFHNERCDFWVPFLHHRETISNWPRKPMGWSVLRFSDRAHPWPLGRMLCSLQNHRTCPPRHPRCGTNMTTTEHRELAQTPPPDLEGPPSTNSSPERWRSGPREAMPPAHRVNSGFVTETARVPLTFSGAGQQRNRGGQGVLKTTTDPGARWPLLTPSTRWLPDLPLVQFCP